MRAGFFLYDCVRSPYRSGMGEGFASIYARDEWWDL
jgi:hypothetical protein